MAQAWTEQDEKAEKNQQLIDEKHPHSRNSKPESIQEQEPLHCGYPKSMFLDEPEEKFICSKCDKLLKNPVQSICGHRFCEVCMQELLKDVAPVCKACVAEGEPGTITDKARCGFPDKAILREMKLQDSRCPHEGCSWQGKFSQYLEHELSCVLRQVLCGDCNRWVVEKDLGSHRDPETGDCDTLKCPFDCDAINSKNHQVGSVVQHTLALLGKLQNVQSSVRNHPVAAKPGTGDTAEKVRELEEILADMTLQITELKGLGTGSTTGNGGNYVIAEDLRKSQEQAAINESLIAVLNREIETLITDQNNLEHERQQKTYQLENLQGRLTTLERTLALKDIDLAEKSMRIEAFESTSYDGTLIWKIKDVRTQRQNAVSGRNLSLYSAPFYTSKSGYKICARIYLNGDGIGRGTHLSLFFVIMRGQFDPILTWPFPHRVTFTLLSQTGSENIIDGFRPDPTSSSFRRPTSDMNIASGMPKFCPLNVLDNRHSKYVKDDTMFIKVQVICNE